MSRSRRHLRSRISRPFRMRTSTGCLESRRIQRAVPPRRQPEAWQRMQQDSRTRLKQWLESGEARLQPLSFPQRELWENSPVPAGSAANNICCLIEIKGALTEKETAAAI